MLAAALLAADRTSLPLRPGRTTAITVTADVGAPLERAVPSKFYAQAATADAEQRWADAAALYREAVAEWTATGRTQPSRALELAIAKAERERQRSQAAGVARAHAPPAASRATHSRAGPTRSTRGASCARSCWSRARCRARATGAVPARARSPARRPARRRGPAPPRAMGGDAEIHLLLCSTYATGGDIEAARLARAHVTEADRADPANTARSRGVRGGPGRDARRHRRAGDPRPAPRAGPHRPLRPARAVPEQRLGPPPRRPPLREPVPALTLNPRRRPRRRRIRCRSEMITPVSKLDAVAGSQRDSTSAAAAPCLNSALV